MIRLAAMMAGGLVATVLTGVIASLMGPTSLLALPYRGDPSMPLLKMVQPLVAKTVDRSRKGDRLAPPRQANHDESNDSKIAVVEVVGIRDAAVVYRDRSGRELFRTDPVANVTIVAKGLLLPQVTIRESKQSEAEQVPVGAQHQKVSPELAEGCETVVSPVTAPSLSHLVGRCLAEVKTDTKYAAILR